MHRRRRRRGPRGGATTFDARIAVGVAGRAFAAHELDCRSRASAAARRYIRRRAVGFARRVDGREADQVDGQRDELVDAARRPLSAAVRSSADLSRRGRVLASVASPIAPFRCSLQLLQRNCIKLSIFALRKNSRTLCNVVHVLQKTEEYVASGIRGNAHEKDVLVAMRLRNDAVRYDSRRASRQAWSRASTSAQPDDDGHAAWPRHPYLAGFDGAPRLCYAARHLSADHGSTACGTRANTTCRRCRIRCSSAAAMPFTAPAHVKQLGRPASHGCVRLAHRQRRDASIRWSSRSARATRGSSCQLSARRTRSAPRR